MTMSLTLPSDAATVRERPAAVPQRKGTLLIVDDEDSPRLSVRQIFKDDYAVLMAEDGLTAVDLAQKNKIDVALVDIVMARMSGIEVLERLKFVDPGVQVVMLTAYETTDLMRKALRGGACDYITKPFDVSTLRAAVATAMQRRTLQSEILTHAEKLQQMVDELHSQKIEEQMAKTRGEIYASIIHDINGPLTVISGFVQLVGQRIGGASRLELEDLDFIKDRLKTITRQVTNCVEISRRYLSFLQRQPDQAPRVGVNQLLADLGQLVRVHPSLQNNSFTIHSLPEDLGVRMNGTDFIQTLRNLTVNAFQCTSQPHSVDIEARIVPQALDLTAFKDSPQERLLNVESFENTPPLLKVCVRDGGPGIPQATLPKIFDARFSTKAAGHGTGLGLNIVLRLVKESRGMLHVHTKVGEGTCFTIYLPAVPLVTA
jgi:two-component system, sensor histidine kinase and response regulator